MATAAHVGVTSVASASPWWQAKPSIAPKSSVGGAKPTTIDAPPPTRSSSIRTPHFVLAPRSDNARIASPAPRSKLTLTIDKVRRIPIERTKPRDSSEPEVPWFWEALRSRVYDQMPQMQRRDMTIMLSPVIVTGTDDTVPGLGVGGDF